MQRDMAVLADLANVTRRAKAQLRRDMASGAVSLADVLADPPECLYETPTFQVLLMQRRFSVGALAAWNAEASKHRMNLALPPARLSARTREWLIWRAGERRVTFPGSVIA